MIKLLGMIFMLMMITGCSSLSMQEQSPTANYTVEDSLLFTIIDERVNNKPKNYVGTKTGSFFPSDLFIKDLTNDPDDQQSDLSDLLTRRFVTGLNNAGWHIIPIYAKTLPTPAMAELMMNENKTERMVVLVLREWLVSGQMLDTDVDIYLFQSGKGQILKTDIRRRNYLDPEGLVGYIYSMILRGYRMRAIEIINDPELKRALRG